MSINPLELYIVDSIIIIIIFFGCFYKCINNNYSMNEMEEDNNYLNYKFINNNYSMNEIEEENNYLNYKSVDKV